MDVSSIAAAGLDVAQSRFEKAATGLASTVATTGPDASAPDHVSLSRQAVSLLSARNEFSADVRLAHVADDLKKTTLNLMA
jgi:hypothetical protein